MKSTRECSSTTCGWKLVLRKDVLEGTKILTLTWAMKKKANGTYHARMNARGYEQVDGKHYNGAFLNGELDEHVKCYLEVPEGFKKYYLPKECLCS